MGKRSSLARLLTGLLGFVLAFGLAVGLSGCGKNDEQLIRSSVTEVLDTFKNPTPEGLQKYIDDSNVDLSTLEEYDVDFTEFMMHMFKHFDYTIDDVKVDGDAADVSVTLSNADLNAALEATLTDLDDLSEYADMLSADDGQKQFMKMFMQKLYEHIDSSEDIVSNSATLKLNKVDNEWSVDEASLDEVVSAMYGGFEL